MSLILILINICWSLSLLSDTLKAYLVKGFLHLANDIFLLYYQIYHSSYTNCDCEKECQEPKSVGQWYHAYQKEDDELDSLIYFHRLVTPQNLNKISITCSRNMDRLIIHYFVLFLIICFDIFKNPDCQISLEQKYDDCLSIFCGRFLHWQARIHGSRNQNDFLFTGRKKDFKTELFVF